MAMLLLLLALSLPFAFVLARSPLIRRLSTRHSFGRPVEALLVIAGSLLGTAIITGSLIVGDTINRSIRAAAYDQLGPIDELVSVPLPDGPALQRRLSGLTSPVIDGVLTMTTTPAAVIRPGSGGGTQPRAQLLEVDFAEARRFGGDTTATGISGPTPRPGTAAVTADLADKLGIHAGVAHPRVRRRRPRDARRRSHLAPTGGRRLLDHRPPPAVLQRVRGARHDRGARRLRRRRTRRPSRRSRWSPCPTSAAWRAAPRPPRPRCGRSTASSRASPPGPAR